MYDIIHTYRRFHVCKHMAIQESARFNLQFCLQKSLYMSVAARQLHFETVFVTATPFPQQGIHVCMNSHAHTRLYMYTYREE